MASGFENALGNIGGAQRAQYIVPGDGPRQSEISGVSNQLAAEIDEITQIVERLANKIGTVLRPQPPETAEKNVRPMRATPLGQELDTHLQRLSMVRASLLSLIERAEV